MNNKLVYIVAGSALLLGAVGSIAFQTFAAQTSTTSTTTTPVVQNSTTTNEPMHQGHMPLGQDGIVSSVNGSTIVMGEEADEGGASYTVDASAVTQLPAIKVGDKIFVEGTVTGTTVKATSISLGHPNFRGHEDGTNDGETNDDGGTSTSPSTSSN